MERVELLRTVDEHLARLAERTEARPEPRFGPWHIAAAVLHTFDEGLEPAGISGPEEDFDDVLDGSTAVQMHDGEWRYELEPGVRRSVLQQLGTREAMLQARAANQGAPSDAVQEVFDACIRGPAPLLHQQDERQLAAMFEVAAWLHGIVDGVPDQASVRTALDQIYLLAPFEGLVKPNFSGRRDELEMLRDYVGVLSTGKPWSWLRRQAEKIANWHEKPPLVIHGPGGIGKSTLLGKFVLDHVKLDEEKRFPFVYLDFDRPDLVAAEPLTILLEAARQLGIQWPKLRLEADALRRRWAQQITEASQSTSPALLGETGVEQSGPVIDWDRYIKDFGRFMDRPEFAGRPLLLVLDTFEEVQVRSQAAVDQITGFLEALQERVPRLRTVFSGRSALEDESGSTRRTRSLPLLQLDPAAAAAILRAAGMPEPVASRTAEWVGGHPLDLQLASELLRRLRVEYGSDDQALEMFEREAARAQVERGSVHRFLYGRILAHIRNADERVSALAHPGLVLRRITPELILDVLAGPCKIKVTDLEDAEGLLKELGKEVALVTTVGEREVRHLPSVRKPMLRAMAADLKRPVIERIHGLAVDFYAKQYDRTNAPADRAEELYHRLALDQRAEQLDPRWIPEVQPLLFTVVDELPPAARAWLSTKLRIELDPEARQAAPLEVWERDAERRVSELLQFDQPRRALDVLRERDTRTPASPLFVLEAQALEATGDADAAIETVNAGIAEAFRAGTYPVRLDLLLLAAEIERRRGRLAESAERLSRAELLATRRGDHVAQIRAAATRLELAALQTTAPGDGPLVAPAELLDGLSDAELRLAPDAARRVAAELTHHDRAVLTRVVRLAGVGVPDPRRLVALGQALEGWDAELAADRGKGAPEINTAALRKVLEQNFSHEQLLSLFAFQVGSAVLASSESPALSVIAAFDRRGALGEVVEVLERERKDVTASVRKSTGPVAREFDLQSAPDGTIESFVLTTPTLLAAPLARVLEKFTPPTAVLNTLAATLRGRGDRSEERQRMGGATVAVRLTGEQRRALHQALLNAFPTYENLRELVYFGLDQNLESIAPSGQSLDIAVYHLLRWAESIGRLPELVSVASRENPENAALQQAAVAVGLSTDVESIASPGVLERIALGRNLFLDINTWRRNLATLEGRVCLVRLSGKKRREVAGTGFLVAPDLVLTSKALLPDGTGAGVEGACRFDFRAVGRNIVDPGTEVPLGALAVVDADEVGEYALLRLARSIGWEPAGGGHAPPKAPPRGWFELPATAPEIPEDATVLVLQHGSAGVQKLSLGSDAHARGRSLEYRVATEAGATGAPVFLADLQLVAVHQAKSSSWAWNKKWGTSIWAVVERLREKRLLELLPRPLP